MGNMKRLHASGLLRPEDKDVAAKDCDKETKGRQGENPDCPFTHTKSSSIFRELPTVKGAFENFQYQ